MSDLSPRVIGLTIPTPFPIGPVNAYLIEDEPLTLIDSGPKTEEAWQALTSQLAAHGYQLSDIEQLVLTHPHIDHFGLLRRLVETLGLPVYAHRGSVSWLRETPHEWERRGQFYRWVWRRAGVPPDALETQLQIVQLGSFFSESLPDQAEIRVLGDGDTLRMGGVDWRVLHTPGHASSHISLYEPHSQQMVAGDHLLLKVSSNPVLEPPPPGATERDRSLLDYMRSMRRVARIDISVVWPGHGPAFHDHQTLIANRLAHHADRAETLFALLAEQPLTVYELTQRLFPRLPTPQLFLGLSEVIGHLDLLEERGRVREVEGEDGVVRYHTGV